MEAQADRKGPVRGLLAAEPARELHLFRLVLGYSRRRITFVAFRLKLAEVLWDLRRAFERLEGVPRRLVTDNPKAAVLVPRPSLRLHPFFSSCCDHYGVRPDLALPNSPERKGKVERSFGAFVDDEILQPADS